MEPIGPLVERILRRLTRGRPPLPVPTCDTCGGEMTLASPVVFICPRCTKKPLPTKEVK
jgi:hypothetical protein